MNALLHSKNSSRGVLERRNAASPDHSPKFNSKIVINEEFVMKY